MLLGESIRQAAPQAEEVIRCNFPTKKQEATLVYFAVQEEHIGFYPFPSAIDQFRNEIKEYDLLPGTVKFPFDKQIPVSIVKKMVRFRSNENLEKASMEKSKPIKRNSGF